MGDIHNIVSKAKKITEQQTTGNYAASDLSAWIKEEFPILRTEFVINQSNVMTGLFFQDNLLLCDATHKTNVNGMPFCALLVVNGEGDSQVVAAFLWNRIHNQ